MYMHIYIYCIHIHFQTKSKHHPCMQYRYSMPHRHPGFLSSLSCCAIASEKKIGCWLLANSCRALLSWSFGGGTTGKNRGFHFYPQPKVPLSSEAVARAHASVSEIGKLLLGLKKEEREVMFDSHDAQVSGDRMPLTSTR